MNSELDQELQQIENSIKFAAARLALLTGRPMVANTTSKMATHKAQLALLDAQDNIDFIRGNE